MSLLKNTFALVPQPYIKVVHLGKTIIFTEQYDKKYIQLLVHIKHNCIAFSIKGILPCMVSRYSHIHFQCFQVPVKQAAHTLYVQ